MPVAQYRNDAWRVPDTSYLVPTCQTPDVVDVREGDTAPVTGYWCNEPECNPNEDYWNYAELDDEDDYDDEEPPVTYNPNETPPEGRHWIRAGVELEGAWNDDRSDIRARMGTRGTIKGDGSVHAVADGWAGEFATRPYKTWDNLERCVRDAHPDVVDDSCGMHVHTSWTLGDYARLMNPEFPKYFRGRMAEYAVTLPPGRARDALQYRLAGSNTYCRVNTDGDMEEPFAADRYRQLNYCWNAHRTLECRLLPAFDTADESIAAIRFLLSVYEDYLNSAPAIEEERADAGVEFLDSEELVVEIPECEPLSFDDENYHYETREVPLSIVDPQNTTAVLVSWSNSAKEYVLRSALTNVVNNFINQGVV